MVVLFGFYSPGLCCSVVRHGPIWCSLWSSCLGALGYTASTPVACGVGANNSVEGVERCVRGLGHELKIDLKIHVFVHFNMDKIYSPRKGVL